MSNAVRLALESRPSVASKEKGAPVADGVLSVTPDPPEVAGLKSVLDEVALESTFLDDDTGKNPDQLFGKFTWKIENFSEISKRELRSNQFDVGEYKWYILVYPQGCDVCNHLSLFLCVADYDKLLPGWSHFAQFTIAVVNKDPKKSKYSDTLHRFCKKEHDWGWKKFMELSKVLDGFTVADTLVIKAQVQVILDRPSRPFRCLDSQYRRELVRVYLTNVESICRRFCEDKRQRLSWLRDEAAGFKTWWRGLGGERQKRLTTERGEAILKGIVKQFFNEKEVTSTLVMDALFCGCKQLDKLSRNKSCPVEGSAPCIVINSKFCTFSFALDALDIVAQLCQDFIPMSRDDKALPLGSDGLGLRSGCDELSELRRDALERDEKRLAELGRRTVEMYALAHIFTEHLERAYRDHQAEKRMKDLIAEEEEAGRLEDERAAARAAADKERRAKKKERKKAKKEAERAKRDAEAAEREKQQEERRAEMEKRNAEANERRRQEEAAQQQEQQEQQQQQQQKLQVDKAAASKSKQQPSAASVEGADAVCSSSSSSGGAAGVVRPKGSVDVVQRPGPGQSQNAAGGDSKSKAVAASAAWGSTNNSPAPGSLADSDTGSSSDSSDSGSIDSSNKGFAPVSRPRHWQQRDQTATAAERPALYHPPGQQQQQHAPGPGGKSSAAGHVASGQQHPPPPAVPPAPAPQQQAAASSSSSIPTGYAAAVAGMRPPPPAEVTAAAALAEEKKRVKDLEQQLLGLKQQIEELEAAVGAKDVVIAERDQEVAELQRQVAAQHQQMQHMQEAHSKALQEARGAADRERATALAAAQSGQYSSSSSNAVVVDKGDTGPASAVSSSSFKSSRSRGTSFDLADGAAAAVPPAPAVTPAAAAAVGPPPSRPVPWAAVAAGIARAPAVPPAAAHPAAAAATAAADSSNTVSSTGVHDLPLANGAAGTASAGELHQQQQQQQQHGAGSTGSSSSSAGEAGSTPSSLQQRACAGPASYAESVSGIHPHHQQQQQQQHMALPGLHGTLGGRVGRSHGSQTAATSSGSSSSSSINGTAPTAALITSRQQQQRPSNSNGVISSPSSSGSGSSDLPAVTHRPNAASRLGAIGTPSHAAAAGSSSGDGAAVSTTSSAAAAASAANGDVPVTPRSGLLRSSSAHAAVSGATEAVDAPPAAAAAGSSSGSSVSITPATRPAAAAAAAAAVADQFGIGSSSATPTAPGRLGSSGRSGSGGGAVRDGLPGLSLKGPAASCYLANGMAGVLHSTTPLSSDGPLTPSYRNNSTAGAAAAPGAAAGPGGSGMAGGVSGAAGGDGQPVPQHPFGGFGSQMPAAARGMAFGPMTATKAAADGVQRASQSSILEDPGLDGFVHMHMIDDLLTE